MLHLDKRLFPNLLPPDAKGLLWKNRRIDALFASGTWSPEAEGLKKDSVYRLTIMHGPKLCNFTCPHYCYTEGLAHGVLDKGQVLEVMGQAIELGMKVTYWPGLGELALLKEFWEIQGWLHEKGIGSFVFTNGSAFWNNELALKTTGMDSDYLTGLVRKLGIRLYVKYWSTDPGKAAGMAGVAEADYPYVTKDGISMPLALARLMERIPAEQLGVEIMVARENHEDVVNNMLPAVNRLGLYGYVEPAILSGNATGRKADLSLTPKQHASLSHLFASGGTYCEKRQAVEMILIGDCLSPGVAIPPREDDRAVDDNGRVRDIFSIFHNEYFRNMRKRAEKLNGCLCRAYWNEKKEPSS